MKKLYTLLVVALLATANCAKASGGPDAYGYTWTTSLDVGGPTFSWIDITARAGVQSVTGLADDNSAPSMISLGIPFHYYWNDYTQLKVGSNGWLSFDNVSNIASCFPTIPTAGNGDNLLCPLMGDLNFTGAGNPGLVKYWSNNIDTFIISYINVPFWSVNSPGWVGSNSFQVILCNTDSSITYQYDALSGFAGNAACIDLTVGIENSTGGIGLQVHSDATPPSSYVIRFTYPNPVLLSIQDALPVWMNNTSNKSQFIFNNTPFSLVSDIKNGGNTGITTTINLTANVIDAASTTIHTATGSLPSLAAGDDSVYTFSPDWTPSATGQYTTRTTLTNSQDVNSANNTLNTEVDVVDPCAASMQLNYLSGNTPNGSLNWNGGAGDDGAAVYFAPPVYPYTISALQYYISSNVSDYFIAQIYDDDGPNGGPGTQLFTTTVPSASVINNSWNTVSVTTPVTLNSGGFYVVWLQGGTTIFLGTETTAPLSHQNYEILDNAWATYREDGLRDLCIRAMINGYTNVPTAGATLSTNLLTLTTTNTTTGLVTSYLWDFGDATTSTQQNPTHTYASGGTYNVCLIATSSCGADTICQVINVCQPPAANYMSSTNGLNAAFMDMSTGTISSWAWDFGDGSPINTSQSPSYTYAAGGTYTVCLMITDACGQMDTFCQNVSVCAPNAAAFTATGNTSVVTFSDLSTGAVDSWLWDFGDLTTSTQQNPTHSYASSGTYNVCLIVSNNCGSSDTSCQVMSFCNPNYAGFLYSSVEDSITVTDVSVGDIITWLYDFGDGNYANAQNPPPHHYATGGIYTVCLITTDICGISDTTCIQDTILITQLNETGSVINAMYPNPVSNELTIVLNQGGAQSIEIFNAVGEIVLFDQNLTGPVIHVDVKDLASGMYTVRVTTENGITVQPFLKN